VQLGTLP
jgi:hypothetical protein